MRPITRLRLHTARERTVQARLADAITSLSGSLRFVSLHIGWFGAWLLMHTGRIGIPPFDPVPLWALDDDRVVGGYLSVDFCAHQPEPLQ